MKKNNILIAVIAATLIVVALCAAACVTTEDTQINDAFALAAESGYLKVEVSDDNGVFYIYDNGTVTDTYNLGIKFEDVVGAKGEAVVLKRDNLKEGYVCETDETTGRISLAGELVGTGALGIDGAKVTLEADTAASKLSTFIISYTDGNGYKVRISLA